MSQRWSPYFWVCFSMCVGVMGTVLASPLYPLYAQAWDLRPSQITQIYVVYMMGAMASLLFLGRLTDYLGFMRVLRLGLVFSTLGSGLSMLAWDAPSFMLARVLVGISSGLITTSASVGMTQLQVARGGSLQRAAAMTSLTIAAGFGVGPIVGGITGQWFPWPLVTSYLPSVVLGLLALYALHHLRQHPELPESARPTQTAVDPMSLLRECLPRLTFPERPLLARFLTGSMTAFCTFSLFSLYGSLAPSFMRDMVPWHGPVVAGLAVGIILLMSAVVQYFARPLPLRWIAPSGMALQVLCCALLMLNTWLASPIVFALCVIVTATGHGLSSMGGIAAINAVSGNHNRSGLMATYLVIGYVGSILPILGMGWLSDHVGLSMALVLYCCLMCALCSVVLWSAWRVLRNDPAAR